MRQRQHDPRFATWQDDWLDLVLGASCVACGRPGRLLCPACHGTLPAAATRVEPDPCPPGFAPCHAAAEYADPVRRMILLHKEQGVFGLVRPLGELLAGPVRTGLDAGAARSRPGRAVLVPVPSRPAVVRARGHDPVLRISRVAAGLLRADGVEVSVSRLLRLRDVVADQAGLTAAERSTNLDGRMAVVPRSLRALARSGEAVRAVVCDDVVTTGSTAREAQRALESVGVPVAAIGCVAATRKRLRLPKRDLDG